MTQGLLSFVIFSISTYCAVFFLCCNLVLSSLFVAFLLSCACDAYVSVYLLRPVANLDDFRVHIQDDPLKRGFSREQLHICVCGAEPLHPLVYTAASVDAAVLDKHSSTRQSTSSALRPTNCWSLAASHHSSFWETLRLALCQRKLTFLASSGHKKAAEEPKCPELVGVKNKDSLVGSSFSRFVCHCPRVPLKNFL